jgi:Zn ribbon nucleic-acid-binding protein
MTRCPNCQSADVVVTSAGLDWLVECLTCNWWGRISDEELMAS